MLNFDHNATSPLHHAAKAAWLAAHAEHPANPASPHRPGQRAGHALETAREHFATLLGCPPSEVIWTSGATESCNLVFHHLERVLPPQAEIWISALEHPCVRVAASTRFGPRCRELPVTRDGVIDLSEWQRRGTAVRPGAVVLMAANHETGVLQPWREMLGWCRERGIPLICDATQWLGRLPGKGLGACDFSFGSAHKFGGPGGVGFLGGAGTARLQPTQFGGHQESGRRAGTVNLPGVMGMLAALQAHEADLAAGAAAEREARRARFERRLIEVLPEVRVVGAGAARLWNTVAAVMPMGATRHRWVVRLDRHGVAVSTGSACTSGREDVSPVLLAMGYDEMAAARTIRMSAGWETTEADWDFLLDAIRRVASLDQPAATD